MYSKSTHIFLRPWALKIYDIFSSLHARWPKNCVNKVFAHSSAASKHLQRAVATGASWGWLLTQLTFVISRRGCICSCSCILALLMLMLMLMRMLCS